VRQKDAVLFDLFHTLTALESTWGDSRVFTHQMLGVSKEAWNEQLLERSRDRLVGTIDDPHAIIRKLAHAIDPTIREEVIEAAVANRIERFAHALVNVPQENVRVLRTLKAWGKTIGLISNADASEVAAWDRSPIARLFDSVVLSCRVGCVKPEPRIYRICMDQLGVTPDRCVFVGDGGSGELAGARNLGIATVMVTGIISQIWPDRIEQRRAHADYVIENLSELIRDHA
jgi:putative hydrolase of the HAD superfamily